MKVEIRYLRIAHLFGRTLVYGQLYDYEEGTPILGDMPLPALLQHIYDEQDSSIDLVNAEDILDFVVRQNGFGA